MKLDSGGVLRLCKHREIARSQFKIRVRSRAMSSNVFNDLVGVSLTELAKNMRGLTRRNSWRMICAGPHRIKMSKPIAPKSDHWTPLICMIFIDKPLRGTLHARASVNIPRSQRYMKSYVIVFCASQVLG